jgi:hypothetical protein
MNDEREHGELWAARQVLEKWLYRAESHRQSFGPAEGEVMGVQHLEGKRTGRPKGSKSSPVWVRAARWALANLDYPDAVPPSPLAGRLLALGRESPDRLVLCLEALRMKAVHSEQEPQRESSSHDKNVGRDERSEESRHESAVVSEPVPVSKGDAVPLPLERESAVVQSAIQVSRKLKTLLVPKAVLLRLLLRCRLALPADVSLIDVVPDATGEEFLFTLGSWSYEAIPERQPIPVLDKRFPGIW